MDGANDRDITPFEASICERLTKELSLCGISRHQSLQSLSTAASFPSLARVLQKTSTAIQFHAKWFAPSPLKALLETGLAAASRSLSTTDLHGALDLIDIVGTYSFLPALYPAVSFIAFAYYQGSRSNRHKKLSIHAWEVAQHILESHLGDQFPDTMLEIISNREYSHSKTNLATTLGALMFTTEQLLRPNESHLSTMNPTQLLLGVRRAMLYDSAIIREQVAILLGTVLQDNEILGQIDRDASLAVCVDLVQRCTKHSLEKDTLKNILTGLTHTFQRFELHQHPAIAQIFLDASVPLPSELSMPSLDPWRRAILVEERPIPLDDYRKMIEKLSANVIYLSELKDFVNLTMLAAFQSREVISLQDFLIILEHLIADPQTSTSVIEVLGFGVVKSFTSYIQAEPSFERADWLFSTLYKTACYSASAADLALKIRSDVAGRAYVKLQYGNENEYHGDEYFSSFHALGRISQLSMEAWAATIRGIVMEDAKRWDVFNLFLASLGPQLCNHTLWQDNSEQINHLLQAVCQRLNADLFFDPPVETGLGKSYVICRLLNILTILMSYHLQVKRKDVNMAIVTFINIAGSRDQAVSIQCIHAITICCYELPELMAEYMDAIISKMSKLVTQKSLAIYVLEFLAGLSRLPALHKRLRPHDFKRIFGVCHSYLQSLRGTSILERTRSPNNDQTLAGSDAPTDDLAQYVYALAHHVIIFWYVALKQTERHGLKDFITSCLKFKKVDGTEHIEDQGLVTVDLMDRVDAEEQIVAPDSNPFDNIDGRIVTRNRIAGLLLITTETALRTGKTLVTIRRPSGTAQRVIAPGNVKAIGPSEKSTEPSTAAATVEKNSQSYISVFPGDVSGHTYGKVIIPPPSSDLGSSKVVTLPDDDEQVTRMIRSFDRTSALDSHKAGVIYIGEGQSTEQDILMNQSGSPDYREFLEDLGSTRKLGGAQFNTQGLDRVGDADGAHTIVWNNEVTELVYHITTFMPTDPSDVQLTVVNKKKHVGNDFVNIVFNNSGSEFDFDTFPSAFNYVYIVIAPSDRNSFLQARTITSSKDKKDRFYNVHVLTRPGYPNLSSASEAKVISGTCLGGYVRNLALNACVFATMWAGSETGEYPSSWRQRLHMVRRLYGQYK